MAKPYSRTASVVSSFLGGTHFHWPALAGAGLLVATHATVWLITTVVFCALAALKELVVGFAYGVYGLRVAKAKNAQAAQAGTVVDDMIAQAESFLRDDRNKNN